MMHYKNAHDVLMHLMKCVTRHCIIVTAVQLYIMHVAVAVPFLIVCIIIIFTFLTIVFSSNDMVFRQHSGDTTDVIIGIKIISRLNLKIYRPPFFVCTYRKIVVKTCTMKNFNGQLIILITYN